jgi:hypothetical protein
MSMSYAVQCPHLGCEWVGRLPASPESEAWRGATANVSIVAFHCPSCHQSWRARAIGDDVEALPLDAADEFDLVAWPPLDIGGGD